LVSGLPQTWSLAGQKFTVRTESRRAKSLALPARPAIAHNDGRNRGDFQYALPCHWIPISLSRFNVPRSRPTIDKSHGDAETRKRSTDYLVENASRAWNAAGLRFKSVTLAKTIVSIVTIVRISGNIRRTKRNIQDMRDYRAKIMRWADASCLWMGKKGDGALSENEINDGESPLADTPADPSGVFINSSRIQLVGLFVRSFSLTPPSHCSFTSSAPSPVLSCHAISFPICLLRLFSSQEKNRLRKSYTAVCY